MGVHGGFGSADIDVALTNGASLANSPSRSFDANDFIYGGQFGFNVQSGRWVFGGEVSVTGGLSENTENVRLFGAGAPVGTFTTELDTLFTATLRAGYTWDRSLVYVKGGFAAGHLKVSTDDNVPPDFISSSSNWARGWTIGTGWEYRFTKQVSLAVEYSFVSLHSDDLVPITIAPTGAPLGLNMLNDSDIDIHSVTARLNYKFTP